MSATDELRRLLDDRGVKWRTDLSVTNKVEWTIWPSPWFREVWAKEIDGRVSIFNAPMTPAQAIEATLGSDLQAENAKLKELVRVMAYCMQCERDCDGCAMNGADGPITELAGCDGLRDRMRELGVEVEQ